MKTAEWLSRCEPSAPAALGARVTRALGSLTTAPRRRSDELLAAAEALLTQLLREGCATRSAAIDLLAADALVTYAFEAAAEDEPSKLEAAAAAAMRRISALGQGGAA